MFRITAQISPFSSELSYFDFSEGMSVADCLDQLQCDHSYAFVQIDGTPILPELYSVTYPKPIEEIILKVAPGKGRKGGLLGFLGIGLSLAVGGIFGLLGFGIGAVGLAVGGTYAVTSLVTSAIIAPPKPVPPPVAAPQNLGSAALPATTNTNTTVSSAVVPTITGFQNQSVPFGVVPQIYGQIRVFPSNAAQQYTEIVGNKQYVRALFVLGPGPLNITDLRIGNTPIEDFNETDPQHSRKVNLSAQDVQIEIRKGLPTDAPITLYTKDFAEESENILLSYSDGPTLRVMPQEADELSMDFTFPNGLTQYNDDGSTAPRTVQINVSYRKVGDTDWINFTTGTLTNNTASVCRHGIQFTPTGGRALYEVSVHRVTVDTDNQKIQDKVYLTALRAIRNEDPIAPDYDGFGNPINYAKVAIRVRATDKLQGIIDNFNCVAESILPVWTGTEWEEQATHNPAWAYVHVLCGPQNARPANRDTDIDLPKILEWAQDNEDAGRELNVSIDDEGTVFDRLQKIAGVGRATYSFDDGKFSVIQDKPQDVPVQTFTPRNSRNWSIQRSWLDIPDAFKVQFNNKEAGYQQDQIYVYNDGYNSDGSGGKTRASSSNTEQLPLWGITDATQAWKEGRYHIASLKLRPRVYRFETDFEHFVCRRGSRIKFVHDAFAVGLGHARITAVTLDEDGNCTGLDLNDSITMSSDTSYAVRIRKANFDMVVRQVVTNSGTHKSVVFSTPIPAEDADIPDVGDLLLFGVLGRESADLIISMIEPGADLTAYITALDYDERIYTADTEDIPEFVSIITVPPVQNQSTVAPPKILNIRSDETVLIRGLNGSLQTQILLDLASTDVQTEYFEARFQPHDEAEDLDQSFTYCPRVNADSGVISITGVQDGAVYDIDVRSISRLGITSDWVSRTNYTVIGKTSPPPDIQNPRFVNGLLLWDYPNAPPDLAGFKIRSVAGSFGTWASATDAHQGLITINQFDTSALPGGTRQFLIKAVDTAGNESVSALSIASNLGDVVVENVIVSKNYKTDSWPGTITGGAVVGTHIEADTLGTFWSGNNSAQVWSSDAAAYWSASASPMTYDFDYDVDPMTLPARMTIDLDVDSSAWSLQYKKSGDTEYLAWPGQLDAEDDTYNFRITTAGGSVQGVISEVVISLDVPDVSETLGDVAISSAGTRLAITKTYRAIRVVSATLVFDGTSTAVLVKSIDKATAIGAGPLVKAYDISLSAVDATADFVVQGY